MNWGTDTTLVTVARGNYFPGIVGLWNSAIENQFKGQMIVFSLDDFSMEGLLGGEKRIRKEKLPINDNLHDFIARWGIIEQLPAGNYIFLDADFIFERPVGFIFENLKDSVIVSVESEKRYYTNDILLKLQSQIAGIEYSLAEFPYVNAGLLGFQLPRDFEFIQNFYRNAASVFKGSNEILRNPIFPFLDQDLLNLHVRSGIKKGTNFLAISPRILELGRNNILQKRVFPSSAQKNMQPKDQIKYMIHGASLRRPWLYRKDKRILRSVGEVAGILPALRRLNGSLSPYERAWAYYACRESTPIPVSAWAPQYGFMNHKNPIWRLAYGLKD